MKRTRKAPKAFTLIELIVVIVIIGILASVGAVAYNSIIENANLSAKAEGAAQVAKIYQAQSAFDQTGLGAIGGFGDLDGRVNWAPMSTTLDDASLCDSPRPGADIPAGIQDAYDQVCAQYRPDSTADIISVGNGIWDTTSFWLDPLTDNSYWVGEFTGVSDGDLILVTTYDGGQYDCVINYGPAQTTVGWDHFVPVGTAGSAPECLKRW